MVVVCRGLLLADRVPGVRVLVGNSWFGLGGSEACVTLDDTFFVSGWRSSRPLAVVRTRRRPPPCSCGSIFEVRHTKQMYH